MRNRIKKSVLFVVGCLVASSVWADNATFGFESDTELSNNFTYSCEYPNGTMTIASDQKKNGSTSLKAYMGGSGGKNNYLITKTSYSNISQIKFYLASSDKGKTALAIESCASANFASGVNTILAMTTYSGLPGVPSSPSNKTFYEITITPSSAITGYLRFTFRQPSSSGKYMWMDDLTITYTASGGGDTPPVSGDPIVTSATWANIEGTAAIDQENGTITGQVAHGSSLTIAPTFTANATIVSQSPNTAQDFSNGPVLYTFTFAGGAAVDYNVTITEAAGGDTPGGGDQPGGGDEPGGGDQPGGGDTPTPIETNLTLHEPEVYEANNGYKGTLSIYNGREYEVYYASFDNESNLSVTVSPVQKSSGMTTSLAETQFKASDGWFEASAQDGKSNYTFTDMKEFQAGSGAMHKMRSGDTYTLHVKGYDCFTFYGKDNNATESKGKHFEVYIDNVKQTMTLSTTGTLRSFNMTSGEHLIEVKAVGESKCEFYGFSLRIPQEPRVKWLRGNDSTQNVLQTTAIRPISYFTKYNRLGNTRLIWEGAEATGISLSVQTQAALGDTLVVSGIANCPVGEYHYRVVAYLNGQQTNMLTGSFTVSSQISPLSGTHIDTYKDEDMDDIPFLLYALSEEDVTLSWKDNHAPTGISGRMENGKYILGGTPTETGEFIYTISVNGGNSITDTINVHPFDTNNPVLYLYKNDRAFEKDGVYNYLKSKGRNMIARKAKNALREADQYAKYQWVMISEDADADNAEVLAILRGETSLPVLNLKGFTYSFERLQWGEPDNGAIDSTATKEKGCYLHVRYANHPAFAKIGVIQSGDSIKILKSYDYNGIMPINVTVQGSLCLGTAYTRSIDSYYAFGELQTALHEIPASKRNGHKYICLPLARNVTLTTAGENLIDGIVTYLLSSEATSITVPELKITAFQVGKNKAEIDQDNNIITLRIPIEEYDALENAQPTITLADPTTHVTPDGTPSIDLRYAAYISKSFVVSDYINRRTYNLDVEMYDPEGIDETYESGMWVNIYDIYGRKVATTNEDIRTMELPRGIYIVVTESGQTIKIMR